MDIGKLSKAQISDELTKRKIVHSSSWTKEKLEMLLIEAMQDETTTSEPTKAKTQSTSNKSQSLIMPRIKTTAVLNFIFFVITFIISALFLTNITSDTAGEIIGTGKTNETNLILGVLFIMYAILNLISGIMNVVLVYSDEDKQESLIALNKLGIAITFGLPLISSTSERVDNSEVDKSGTKLLLALAIVVLLISIAMVIASICLIIGFSNSRADSETPEQYDQIINIFTIILIVTSISLITSIANIIFISKYTRKGSNEKAMAISSIINFFTIYGIVFGIKRLSKN